MATINGGKMYKCEFCGKEFKTDKGFNKHLCEKKKRFVNFDEISYQVWLTICNVFKIRLPKNRDDKTLRLKFINDKSYKALCNFAHWLVDTGIINAFSYISFLKTNMIPMKQWTASNTHKAWLYQYLKDEPEATSIKRSEDYLKQIGVTLDTISQNRLYLAIRYGLITNKYLKSKKFNVQSVLDENQWSDIRPFIITDVVERMNNALHNS